MHPEDDAPDHEAWTPWSPQQLAQRLQGLSEPWCVVGGWALDLWHGRQTRPHGDLEFAVLREHLPVFMARLSDLRFFAARQGVLTPCPAGAALPEAAQFWGLDPATRRWCVDLMVEPGTPDTWVFKRQADLTGARVDMVRGLEPTPANEEPGARVPHLCPAAVLLFKAKATRDKDEADFERALPRLSEAERAWLSAALSRTAPGHAWLQRLARREVGEA